jgi:hypothetical protein
MGEVAIKEQGTSATAIFMNPTALQALVQFADLMAKAAFTVPKHLQGKPSDCLAIAMQAQHWGMDPFVVAQKTHLVNGTLGYEAQLVNAVIQNSGAVEGAPSYEYQGEGNGLECRVGFVLRGHKAITWGEWLRSGDVTTKNSPLWKVNPKQQLAYLQIKNWSRLYCPGAILGIYTEDELVDFTPPGAKNMGAVDEVQRPKTVAELPLYEAAKFEQNLPTWTKKIVSGEKTAQQLIDWLQTKARLTEAQVKRLRDVKVAEVVDSATGEITNGHGASDADAHPLELAMNKAVTRDDLDVLADRINSEAGSPDWVTYLQSVYHTNVERLDR